MTISATVRKFIPVYWRAPLRKLRDLIIRNFSSSRLTDDQSALLELMRRDNQVAEEPFRESTRWQHTNNELSFQFASGGINNAPSQQFIHHYSTPVTGASKWRKHAFHLLQSLVEQRDKWGVLDSIKSSELKKKSAIRLVHMGSPDISRCADITS
jgi:hypothetical protein